LDLLAQLVHGPHEALHVVVILELALVLGLLDNAVVGQVGLDAIVVGVLFAQSESDLALVLDEDGQRVEVCHEYPLAHVKLALVDDERLLYLLLSYVYVFLFVD